jgi:trehalose utilization protein
MYGERFDIPQDGKIIFISWFEGGEVFRSGVTFERGHGKIFYFQPGHETYPIFYNEKIIRIISNAVRWGKPLIFAEHEAPQAEPLEKIQALNS